MSKEFVGFQDSQWDTYNVTFINGSTWAKSLNISDLSQQLRLEFTVISFTQFTSGGNLSFSLHAVLPSTFTSSSFPPSPLYTVAFSFANTKIQLSTDSTAIDFTGWISASTGTSNFYPFDSYQVDMPITAIITDGNSSYSLNIQLAISNANTGFFVHSQTFTPARASSALTSPKLSFYFYRTGLFQIYPTFVFVSFWCVVLSLAFFLLPRITLLKKIDNPVDIVVVNSFLFSLPALRSTLPDAPAYGCVADFITFFWVMIIVCFLLTFSLYCWFQDSVPVSKK